MTKAKLMHFTSLTGMHNSPEIKLGDQILPHTDKTKIHGAHVGSEVNLEEAYLPAES